jgi:glycosyltransferase involved in cell wall biosynthesis
MARVLWLGDAGCTTGFATVTHAIGDRLVSKFGHDIHVLATNFQGDHWPTQMKLYVPTMREPRDTYGVGRYVEMLGKVMPDVVVTLRDPLLLLKHLFKSPKDEVLALARTAPIVAYMPIDGYDYPDPIRRMPELVGSLPPIMEGRRKPSLTPVVMAKHGNTVFPDAPLVYHGVDTDMFRSVRERPIVMSDGTKISSKAEAKRVLQIPDDAKLIVRVDRNSERKNFGDTYRALVPVLKQNPDVHVWWHSKDDDPMGVDFSQLVSRDMSIAGRFHWPGQYDTRYGWRTEDLVTVYNAGDVFVSTSEGEGFGLTLLEAAACRLPVIAQNVSAIPESSDPVAS